MFCFAVWTVGVHAEVKKLGDSKELGTSKIDGTSQVEDKNNPAVKEKSVMDATERFKEPPIKSITDLERKQACQKFESKFISSYDLVYFVKKCKRYALSADEVSQLTRKSFRFHEVEQRTIAALEDGEKSYSELNKKKFNCQRFHNSFVTYDLVIFRVRNCTLQEFPDDPTFQEYRRKNQLQGKSILSLSGEEYEQFKVGTPILSILKDTIEDKQLAILPIREVCRNLVGKHVTYLDTIYMINRSKGAAGCWKKAVESDTYTRKAGGKWPKMLELSSSQALSIPDSDTNASQPEKIKPIKSKI